MLGGRHVKGGSQTRGKKGLRGGRQLVWEAFVNYAVTDV